MRRIGVLMNLAADDPEGRARLAAFAQALQQLGWSDGRNLRIDYRWARGEPTFRQACGGIGLARAGRPSGWPPAPRPWHRCCRRLALCRSCSSMSSTRSALVCRELAAPGRQRDWLHTIRIRHEWKMAGTAQRDRAQRDAGGGPSGSGLPGIGQFGAVQSVAPSLGVELSPIGIARCSARLSAP